MSNPSMVVQMTEKTTTGLNFNEVADALEEAKGMSLPISDGKVGMSFSFEPEVKELIQNLANKGQDTIRKYKDKDDVEIKFSYQFDEYPEDLPSTDVGVIIYYLKKGIKQDFNAQFERDPRCLSRKTGSTTRSSAGTLTKEAKNELLAKQSMDYYEQELKNGTLERAEVMELILKAYDSQKEWEERGWFFTPEKTKPAFKIGSEKYNTYLKQKEDLALGRQERGKELGEKRAQEAKAKKSKDIATAS